MGRLYWKFFVVIMLAQIATVVGVSAAISWRHHHEAPPAPRRPGPSALLDAAQATLAHGGPAALEALLRDWSRDPGVEVYAVDAQGHELLGRVPPPAGGEPAERRTVAGGGASFVLTAGVREHRDGGPPPGPRVPLLGLFPTEPIAGGLLASLAFAALLAWYVAKPIGSLRDAFAAVARGELDTRVAPRMGQRRDELADLGRAFDRTAAQVERLVDGQRRLLHDVSHELRSPLARLQAAVGLARQAPGNLDATMDRIEREAERMDRLVDELLVLSRVEAGMTHDRLAAVDVAELVEDVLADARFEAEAAQRRVTIAGALGDAGPLHVDGNGELLHRALENVVRNAVRHTPDGGRVTVRGARAGAGGGARVVVEDEGPGVPAADLDAIFAPFYRSASAARHPGHGLGLAIARRVVEAHGGTLTAANRPGGGLAVELVLPA